MLDGSGPGAFAVALLPGALPSRFGGSRFLSRHHRLFHALVSPRRPRPRAGGPSPRGATEPDFGGVGDGGNPSDALARSGWLAVGISHRGLSGRTPGNRRALPDGRPAAASILAHR